MKSVLAVMVFSFVLPLMAYGQYPTPKRFQAETYESADIDAKGNLRIITSDHRRIIVPKQAKQTSFDRPTISSDRRVVGARAMYEWGSPAEIPLQLVGYADGKAHWFKGNGTIMWLWHFTDSGNTVAFEQATRAFVCDEHYELVDVRSERIVDTFNLDVPCGEHPDPPPVTPPRWVKDLQATR